MTARPFSIYRGAAALGGPLLIIGLLFLITRTPGFASHPDRFKHRSDFDRIVRAEKEI